MKYKIFICDACKEQLNECRMGKQCPKCDAITSKELCERKVEIKKIGGLSKDIVKRGYITNGRKQ